MTTLKMLPWLNWVLALRVEQRPRVKSLSEGGLSSGHPSRNARTREETKIKPVFFYEGLRALPPIVPPPLTRPHTRVRPARA